ncbi:hypothetical protein A6E15_04635 [Natrinema saccharevitans]|uniref:Uncharacterized protein n=1 Tax=Natrinema saccharevitans TaxID=301967 RepID=A0A1S8AUG5_9EURY|nr:hypothetical protein [Natrinema saccharevitans]OLZ40312.1 hypothetical protein A6E15_04635 [Natrinema saccharevitans]
MACMVALSMVAVGVPAATAEDAAANSDTIHTLEDGEELYLVFGADLGEQSLEEYIDEHANDANSSGAEVIQHPDVDLVELQERGSAVSIAIDGGEATAIQEANQQNDNVQTGEATTGNVDVRSAETQFENVGEVNIIIGNGDDQQFDGWGIKDKKDDDGTETEEAIASVTQSQTVGQVNYNNQSTAFAFAMDDSDATALQQSYQRNENLQEGMANASNVYLGDGEFGHAKDKSGDESGTGQSASASLDQSQDVAQQNVNEQGGAVAIAIGENSTATAIQFTDQSNLNEQFGSATASNLMASSLGMNVATAGDVSGEVLSTETDTHGPDKKDKNDDLNDTEQTATAAVAQEQEVEQRNINLQNTAMALAQNGSEATAIQLAYQQNYNAQLAYADALNVYASPGYVSDDVTRTSSTTVTVDGNAGMAPGTSYDYAGNATQTNDVEQEASAAIAQQQFITQENLNEQHTSVAVAEDGGSAGSSQISLQENENVQLTSVASTNAWVGA